MFFVTAKLIKFILVYQLHQHGANKHHNSDAPVGLDDIVDTYTRIKPINNFLNILFLLYILFNYIFILFYINKPDGNCSFILFND